MPAHGGADLPTGGAGGAVRAPARGAQGAGHVSAQERACRPREEEERPDAVAGAPS